MRGTSKAARDEVLRAFDPVVTAAGEEGMGLASQLFAVVDALDGSGSLRRALTDPGRDSDDKSSLVTSLFGSYDPRVVSVICDLVSARWSAGSDLASAIEDAGGLALLRWPSQRACCTPSRSNCSSSSAN